MVWSSGKIAERSSMSWFNRSKGYGVHQRKMAARINLGGREGWANFNSYRRLPTEGMMRAAVRVAKFSFSTTMR